MLTFYNLTAYSSHFCWIDLDVCELAAPKVPASSSSCPASTPTRRSTSGPSPSTCPRKRQDLFKRRERAVMEEVVYRDAPAFKMNSVDPSEFE